MRSHLRSAVCLAALVALTALTAIAPVGVELGADAGAVTPGSPTLDVQTNWVTGLDHPWDVGFLADQTMFVTERAGRLKVRMPDGTINPVVAPADVRVAGEGGMLGLAIDPQFATNRYVFTCFSSTLGGPDNRVVRWTVNPTFTGVTARADVVSGLSYSSGRHSGCRPRFGPDGYLWIGTGDAAVGTNPQSRTSLGGKVLRVDRDGAAAPGNPDLGPGSDARIYNYGHRNVQGLAFRPGTGAAYNVEHGTDRDDEVNRLVAGGNYGWDPVPGYDESRPMTDLVKFPSAIGAAWSSGYPTIAPSGATFLSGSQWQGWEGALAVAVLKGTELRVMFLDGPGTTVTSTATPSQLDLGVRLRSAVEGPDGNLYITTDDANGAVWKVVPAPRRHRLARVRVAWGRG